MRWISRRECTFLSFPLKQGARVYFIFSFYIHPICRTSSPFFLSLLLSLFPSHPPSTITNREEKTKKQRKHKKSLTDRTKEKKNAKIINTTPPTPPLLLPLPPPPDIPAKLCGRSRLRLQHVPAPGQSQRTGPLLRCLEAVDEHLLVPQVHRRLWQIRVQITAGSLLHEHAESPTGWDR